MVLVCHGGIVEASFTYFFGMNIHHLQRAGIDTDYTAITHWQVFTREEEWQPNFLLERYNDRHHLDGVDLSEFAEKPALGHDGRAPLSVAVNPNIKLVE